MALILPAYAKLNLTLDVTGRRPNGYHDIDSVMQTISLHDLIWIERTDCRVFDVVGPAIAGENLVLKAARELEGHVSRELPFTIRLFKRVPLAAGLGGGSADAAAFLKAANLLYDLRLAPGELLEIATAVGQDVPFLLSGGTARATGLGSTVSPLPPIPTTWRFLVVSPPVEISTRAVYEAVDGSAPSARRTPGLVAALGAPTLTLPERLKRSPGTNVSNARIALKRNSRGATPRAPLAWADGPGKRGREMSEGERGREMSATFGNDLEPASRRLFPQLDDAFNRLSRVVPGLTMSGTGAALFAAFANRAEADTALAEVRKLGFPVWVCRPVPAAA